MDGFDSRWLRIICNIRWWQKVRNSHIREMTNQPYASTLLRKNHLWRFGHLMQMGHQRLPQRLYQWNPTIIGGKRRQGGQRQRWSETCSRELSLIGLTMQDAVVAAKEREEWRVTVTALM